MKRKEILKAMKAMKSEKPINSMYRMIPKSRMDEFKRFAAIFGFTEENIENILSKEKEMVGKQPTTTLHLKIQVGFFKLTILLTIIHLSR